MKVLKNATKYFINLTYTDKNSSSHASFPDIESSLSILLSNQKKINLYSTFLKFCFLVLKLIIWLWYIIYRLTCKKILFDFFDSNSHKFSYLYFYCFSFSDYDIQIFRDVIQKGSSHFCERGPQYWSTSVRA